MKILTLMIFLSLYTFAGMWDSLTSGVSDLTKGVKNSFNQEKKIKIAVKKAYITKKQDAKSSIVKTLKFADEIKVIGVESNDYWYKVLDEKYSGYIPVSVEHEKTFLGELGSASETLWNFATKKENSNKGDVALKEKNWTDNEDMELHVKGASEDDAKTKKANKIKKSKYDREYIEKVFASLSQSTSYKNVKKFRKKGGLK